MKIKIFLAIAALLVVGAQIKYTTSRGEAKKAAAESSQAAAPAPAGQHATPEPVPAAEAPVPEPESVVGIALSVDGGAPLELRTVGGGWIVASRGSVPADAEKVGRFLNALLRGERQPPTLNADPSTTGLEEGAVEARLALADGSSYVVLIGLRPEGDLGAAFARFGDGGVVVLGGDARGELGLWRNVPGQVPDADDWILTRVFAFNPDDAVRLSARYPDHEIAFERDAGGEWRSASHVPGGEWSRDGLARWLADLSAFAVTGLADGDELARAVCATQPVFLSLTLADGTVKTLNACPNLSSEGVHVGVGEYPELIFELPEWRFEKYFLRMGSLYPKAVPRFAPADIRLLDIRKGGDSVKIARVDGEWRQVGLPYALRAERVERLVRLVSGLEPADFADPGAKPLRTAAGGPVVEVILADGAMHQYRLGGRHPLFPWRYVTVDGGEVLSVADPEAGVLFSGFEEVLDLGTVFAGLDASSLVGMELIRTEDGTKLLSIRRDGEWTASHERMSVAMTPDEVERLVERLARWRVAGLYEMDARAGSAIEGMLRLRVADAAGRERGITLLSPQGRDIPYMADGERPFLLDRMDFFSWLGAVRTLGRRIDEAARAAEPEVVEETPIPDTDDAEPEPEPEPEPDVADEPAEKEYVVIEDPPVPFADDAEPTPDAAVEAEADADADVAEPPTAEEEPVMIEDPPVPLAEDSEAPEDVETVEDAEDTEDAEVVEDVENTEPPPVVDNAAPVEEEAETAEPAADSTAEKENPES